jgi:hypothetical protein
MKKVILIVAIFTTAFLQKSMAQETAKNLLPQLLTDYYNIKDALVAGDATAASLKAADFIKTINGVDYKVISEGNVNTLLKDAGKISESTDLKKQREHFSNFSANMIAVAKAVKLGDKETYVQYCPMKKASWLSSEKAIKNPYYGSSMLTCGQVTETLK